MHNAKRTSALLGAIGCAALVALALAGCTAERPTAGAPDPGLRGEWVLVSGHDRYGAINLLGQDITLTVSGSSVSTGRGSCTNYTASIYGSERSLYVTTTYVRTTRCASADQAVLQLEYLDDLAKVRRSGISPNGLELTGPDVDLHFVRAAQLSLTDLVDKTWELKTGADLNPKGAFTFASETGGYIRFETKSSLSGVTRCVYFTANYRQVADELVASHVLAIENVGCDRATDQAAIDFKRVFDGGFTFALTSNSLSLKSTRAGLALGFNELGTP